MSHEAQIKKFIDILTHRENQWTYYRNNIKSKAALKDRRRGK